MKKMLCLLLVAAMCLSFWGCSKKEEDDDAESTSSRTSEQKLYEYGLEAIALMQEKADSEAYIKLFTSLDDESFWTLIEQFANLDIENPKTVYSIEVPKIEELLEKYYEDDAEYIDYYQSLSANLKEDFEMRFVSRFPLQLLNRYGHNAVLCNSLLSSSTEISAMHISTRQYFLYTYASGATIMVTFAPTGVVSATLASICDKDAPSAVIQEFKDMDIPLKKLKID